MAGDSISATTQYYYQNAVTNTTGNNLTTSIVTALIQSILGSPATGLAKGNTTPQGSLMAGIGMYQAGSAKIDQFKNGNANVKAEIIGAGVGEIFQLFGGEAAEAGKVGEVGKLGEVSEDVEKVAEVYSSLNEFKKVYGKAGDGQAWHHIVEQNPSNIEKFGAESLHTESNLIKVPHGKGSLHNKVSGYYSRKASPLTKGRIRDVVNKMSFEEQYKHGIEALKKFGW